MPKNDTTSRTEICNELDLQAARLAGVHDILLLAGDGEHANTLGVCRDTVNDVNERISELTSQLRYLSPSAAAR